MHFQEVCKEKKKTILADRINHNFPNPGMPNYVYIYSPAAIIVGHMYDLLENIQLLQGKKPSSYRNISLQG